MPPSKSLSAYNDVSIVLDVILARDQYPANYTLSDAGRARNWTHRANAFRLLLRKMEEHDHGLPPGTGTSIYDGLVFSPQDETVIITKRISEGVLSFGDEIVDPTAEEDIEAPDNIEWEDMDNE